jgi:DNA-binding response OmpR family regulator
MKVLIVEDNDILRGNIKKYFEIKWINADEHPSYEWANYKIMTGNYDAVILDLWLWSEEGDGLDICAQVREKWNNVPILILTARTLTEQKIQWLEIWADDYLVKPFDYDELLARVLSISKRNNTLKWKKHIIEDVEIDEDTMSVKQEWVEIDFSKLEYHLLLFLVIHRGKVLSKEFITEKVWGEYDPFGESRTLDIHIWYLRKKLWKDFIETIRGVWYMIK